MSCVRTVFCAAVDNDSNALTYTGTSASVPHLALNSVTITRHGSIVPAGSVVPISIEVRYANGPPIPGPLAEVLAANCDVTVSARGAQRLARHCMTYDGGARMFSYRWRTRTRRTGKVTLDIQLSDPAPTALRLPLTISRPAH